MTGTERTLPDERPPEFESRVDAGEWMYAKVDDPCIDNERFAFLDDTEALKQYEDQKSQGCCGEFDAEIVVGGRKATIGCNYGH